MRVITELLDNIHWGHIFIAISFTIAGILVIKWGKQEDDKDKEDWEDWIHQGDYRKFDWKKPMKKS